MAVDRRTLFREHMRRLDPTGDPAKAVAGGLYVEPPNAVSRQIATRVELMPASRHLLVGGIGSGKTTELIAIEQKLAEVDDLLPVRIDVPSRQRLDKLTPGVLLGLAAVEACAELARERGGGRAVDAELDKAVARVATITNGYWSDDYDGDFPEEGYFVKGILERPQPLREVETLSEALLLIHGALRRKLVLLFDGLDRVTDTALLASVLASDMPAMGRAQVGVVLVGPQLLRFSSERFIEQEFETVSLHGASGVNTPEGQIFLSTVLRARVGKDTLPMECASALVRWSGGLMRDLMALGRAACAEAYASGADAIKIEHVNVAADRFGRDLLFACTKDMVARLKQLFRETPGHSKRPPHVGNLMAFTVATELDQRLLAERLVIEVPGTTVRYVLHPTIVPLISGLGGS
ncbi:hypothetical protein [Sorangium sp. So ce854]|uniref:hypothetical protein n=1 Tax=Sorangium sp. So ce854 TaxID=3133322 RepID=UPI003F5EFC18